MSKETKQPVTNPVITPEKKNKFLQSLENNKNIRLNGENRFLSDVKQLMESNAQEERALLRDIGISKEIEIAEKSIENKILNDSLTKKYEDGIFHINDIEQLALKYRLYLRGANKYRGKIPADLGAVVLNFKKKYSLNINQSLNSDSGKFFVLAPPKMFSDYITPRNKIQTFIDTTKTVKKDFLASLKDPMFFYMVDENHYKILKVWVNDFTLFRRMLGIITKSTLRVKMFTIMLTVLLSILMQQSFLFLGNIAQNYTNQENTLISGVTIGVICILTLASIFYLTYFLTGLCLNNKSYSLNHFSTKKMWKENS